MSNEVKNLMTFDIRGRIKFAMINEPRRNDSDMLYLNLVVSTQDFNSLEGDIRSAISKSGKLKKELVIPYKLNEKEQVIMFFKRKVRSEEDKILVENANGEEFKDKLLVGFDVSAVFEVNYKDAGPQLQVGFKLLKIIFYRALFPVKDQNMKRARSWSSSGHNRPEHNKDKYQSIDSKYNEAEGDLV